MWWRSRYLPLLAWTNHLSVAYFENTGLAQWTLQNPHANPVSAVSLELPGPGPSRHPDAKAWSDRGIAPQAFDWIGADESFQWSAFCRAIDTLQGRGNRVFVLVGPFNEHMIAEESMEAYREILRDAGEWLTQHGVPHWIAPVLPSELYADASHPIAEGYAPAGGTDDGLRALRRVRQRRYAGHPSRPSRQPLSTPSIDSTSSGRACR